MPGTFAYTASTNTVVVTAGTSSSPANFASFVAADLAGTFDLLADRTITAVDGAPVAVTNALRPTDEYVMGGAKNDLSIIVNSWTVMVTATINIVGTDAAGAAINENIIVTGNGTYNATLLYRTLVSTQVTVWTGTTSFKYKLQQGKWGVIWNPGLSQYQVDANFTIGDGSTATFFYSTLEKITFAVGKLFEQTASSTLTIGTKIGTDQGKDGSVFVLWSSGAAVAVHNFAGTQNWYGARFEYNKSAGQDYLVDRPSFDGSGELFGCLIRARNQVNFTTSTYALDNTAFTSMYNGITFPDDPNMTLTKLTVKGSTVAKHVLANLYAIGAYMTLRDAVMDSTPTYTVRMNGGGSNAGRHCDFIDLLCPSFSVNWAIAGLHANRCYEKKTFNIHIVDKSGNNLSGVIVDCQAVDNSYSWTAGSVSTDAGGNIVEQVITTISHAAANGSTADVATNLGPYKFTLSKVGYETLVLENITIDGPIDWYLELQDEVVYPAEGDVKSGVDYGDGGTEFTGSYAAVPYGDILFDVETEEIVQVLDASTAISLK